jgi:hypothetical protein
MTEREDRHSVYRAIKEHEHETPTRTNGVQVEIAVQLRRVADYLEALAESRTSIAVSLDRIADAADRAYPRRRQG